MFGNRRRGLGFHVTCPGYVLDIQLYIDISWIIDISWLASGSWPTGSLVQKIAVPTVLAIVPLPLVANVNGCFGGVVVVTTPFGCDPTVANSAGLPISASACRRIIAMLRLCHGTFRWQRYNCKQTKLLNTAFELRSGDNKSDDDDGDDSDDEGGGDDDGGDDNKCDDDDDIGDGDTTDCNFTSLFEITTGLETQFSMKPILGYSNLLALLQLQNQNRFRENYDVLPNLFCCLQT